MYERLSYSFQVRSSYLKKQKEIFIISVIFYLQIDCTFGDSFCDLGVLDGVCEIEAQYTDKDSLRSSEEEVSSPQNALQNQRLASSSHVTRFADLMRSPRLNSPHSDRVREHNCNPVSKELAENDNDGRQKNHMSMPLGTDTLEAIDAMDLDNSVFPDEITSPGDEIQRDEGQGFSFLRKSHMDNRNGDRRRVCRYSASETVRRSQRLRVKISENTSELKGLPSAKKCFIKEMSAKNKICDVRNVDLLYNGNKGNNSITGEDSVKELNDGQVLKEINTNYLSEISVTVDNSTFPKLNHRQKRLDVKKDESECDKKVENSSGPYKKIYNTKYKKGITEVITDVQNSPVPTSELQIEQENQIKSAVFDKKHKSEPVTCKEIQGSSLAVGQIRKRDAHICTFPVDLHSENYSPESERQVEQELRNSEETHPREANKMLSDVSKRIKSCSEISNTKRKELSGVQTPGREKLENPKSYQSTGMPRTYVELAPVTVYTTAPVKFCNPDKSLAPVNSDALIEAQFIKPNVPDKTQVQINSVGLAEVKASTHSLLSKANETSLKNQLVCDKAQVPVKIDLCNKKSYDKSTNEDTKSPVNSAPNGSESPDQRKDSESPKIKKTDVSLRSPFSVNNETHSFLSSQEKMELSSWGLPDVVLEVRSLLLWVRLYMLPLTQFLFT